MMKDFKIERLSLTMRDDIRSKIDNRSILKSFIIYIYLINIYLHCN